MLKIPARFKQYDLSVSLACNYCDCYFNMGTRAAAFTVKIRSLYDYQLRLLHGIMPLPSGIDIANTVKYFAQTLLTVLKDVPDFPLELLKNPENDTVRMGLFPNLDYKGLYNSLIPLIEVAPLIQYGLEAFGQAFLQCLGCLLPFLENDLIDNLPYLTASSIAILPRSLHKDIVNYLCYYILPFTITRHSGHDEEHNISNSVTSVIMMVFQYSNNPAHHCQLLECLMTFKQNVLKDLLCVIAYGTPAARSSSAKLLFYYWPAFNPNLFDRKNLICKFAGDSTPFVCQRDMCPNAGNAEAAKVCYDHCISITFASDSPPPLYLCIECANEIHREHPNQMFFDILHPMQQVSMVCENKNCRAVDKYAVSICFSTECASYNGNHPIRYCQQCHSNRHNNRRGGDHIVHKSLPPTWSMDTEMQTYMVEAIVSLLKESKAPSVEVKESIGNDGKSMTVATDNISLEERQLLGRYGVWLLVGRCTPYEDTPYEILGRLIAMLFHWFHITPYSYDGVEEGTLEKLKTEYVCSWLQGIRTTHYNLFLSCLLPHPPEYARVGGHWDTLASRTSHLKDGLHRLFCLVPYEIITPEIWDHVMPHWMDAIVNDVPEKELFELKIILSKIFDNGMSPLGIDPSKMYNFIAARFEKSSPEVQEQALRWLQVLTVLEITIPLSLLFKIFERGVCVLKNGETETSSKGNLEPVVKPDNVQIAPVEHESENTTSLSDDEEKNERPELKIDAGCILMLDLLLKQMDLQQIDKHTGINSNMCKDVTRLLKCMVTTSWISSHSCNTKNDCSYCEFCTMWHQLSFKLITFLSPVNPAHPPDPQIEESNDEILLNKSPPEGDKKDGKSEVVINMPVPETHSVGGVLVHMPHVCSIMTATVETVSEQLEFATVNPPEKVMTAVTVYQDTGTATTQVNRPQVMFHNDVPAVQGPDDDVEEFWDTSHGKFRFVIYELPQYVQYIYEILNELPKTKNPDILYYMLQCLNILCLNGDAFTKASKEHRGFFIWAQENVLIKNLWDLCNAEHSHICQVTVPLLLHCITLPAGSDVFWRVIQEDFHNPDWRIRFVAVERVTIIARFMDNTPLRSIQSLQAALATAFCYLINSIDDVNVFVAQRATLYLGTIHDTAIKSLVLCLETQFDMVIVDRPMVLQSLYQLHNSLSDRKILTWEFFLNRFDTLFLEAQINLEKSGDISYLRDLRNTDLNSDIFLRKLQRAQEALSHSDGSGTSSVKTLSASFGTKWPYKRTMSAPASMVPRPDIKQDGHVHSFNMLEDNNMVGYLQRVIDLEEADRETMHLLIFLLMQFLSRSDQAYPTEEKHLSKSQSIVLRHLFLLLGYNQNEKGLYISSNRLRTSPVFSAYLSNLPQLLDQNHLMGWMLLNTSLLLLQYSPSPHYIPGSEHQQPGYSLWSLEPHARHCWLMSLVVLLYKYQYSQQPQSYQLQALVRIVLNTLDSQHHHCRRIPATIVMGAPPSRSRDVSQPSLGADNEHIERINTPPLSPMYSSDGQVVVSTKPGKMQAVYHQKSLSTVTASMETHWEETGPSTDSQKAEGSSRKYLDSSMDPDDTESELVAIPESDSSDSTLHGSVHDSFDEIVEEKHVNTSVSNPSISVPSKMPESKSIHQYLKFGSKRPTWFIGSEEEALNSNSKKLGIQEGVKMMVSSSYLSNSLDKQSRNKNNNNKECPKQSSFGSSGLAGTVAAIAAVSSVPVPKTMTTDSNRQIKSSSMEMKQNENYLDKSKINYQIYSRIFVEKVKKTDPITSPLCTPASDSTSDSSTATQQCDDSQQSWSDQGYGPNNQPLLPTPSVERLLPIGAQRPVLKITPKQINESSSLMRSPDSPLSKMDILTFDYSKECDTDNNYSPEHLQSGVQSQLNLPAQERLLLVGPHSKEINQLVEKVKLALGVQSMAVSSYDKNGNDVNSNHTAKPKMNNQLSNAEDTVPSRSISPRRLIKQVALESPPNPLDLDEQTAMYKQILNENKKEAINTQRQKLHKSGPYLTNAQSLSNNFWRPGSWFGPISTTWPDLESQQSCHANSDLKQSSFRIGDECVSDRCSECGILKEEYSDEEIGLCIIILGTFIHREPALAAPMLPDILSIVSRVAINAMYPWQNETNIHLPGGAVSVAHQFLRCVLHQLAPNGVFIQMFQTQATDLARMQFFRSVSQALLDFTELNSVAPLQFLLESMNSKKTLTIDTIPIIIKNMACYMDCLPLEAGMGPTTPVWSTLLSQLEILFRRIVLLMNNLDDVLPLLRIMVSVLKIPGIAQYKGILDPFSKVLGHAIQTQPIQYQYLVDLCLLCSRAFTRERDKLILCRMVIFELVQALKFKTSIPDSNFLMLVNVVLQDVGGHIPASIVLNCTTSFNFEYNHLYSTSISDCMRLHLGDILEFLTDFHALNKIKSYCKGTNVGLNDDTLGGIIKSSMAQYVALEITRSNGRDNRAVVKYFPWLYSTSSLQQGTREFIDCIGHIRLLSWLLLGSLTHSAIYGLNNHSQINHAVSQPIPQEASCQIADHIQVIMAGFAEQPKASILHMSSLFHAFILCQLWTVYLEQGITHSILSSEVSNVTMNILFDFWGKVTPCILQLVSHSKMLSEMVSLHFLCMLEALLECRSTFLCKLLPLWTPVLYSHHIQLPGHLQVRLQNCRNVPPLVNGQLLPNKNKQPVNNPTLLKWLQKLQFKMGQIELQSSAATQFYSL